MRRVSLGLSLVLLLVVQLAPAALGAQPPRGRTIRDLSDKIPLGVLERSMGRKFFQSLLRSPLEDWATVRAQVAGRRLARPQVIRPPENPAYNSLALKYANETALMAIKSGGGPPAARVDSALMHLLIYKIADGVMAVSFAYPESAPGRQTRDVAAVRLSVKAKGGPWTDIQPAETRRDRGWSIRETHGRRLRRIDRMPMDVITVPRP